MEDAKIISVETIPKVPFVTFEVLDIEILPNLKWTTAWIKNYTHIHSHWAVCVAWFCGIYETPLTLCLCWDVGKKITKLLWAVIKWLGKQIWRAIVYLWCWFWDVAGESIKAFLKSLLKWLGIALAAYAVYVFIKTGYYETLITLIFGK